MKLPNLNEIVFDQKKLIVIFLIFAAILYLDIAMLLKWQLNTIKASGPQITLLKKNTTELNNDITKMEQEKQRQIRETKLSKEKARKIPTAAMLPQVLSKISDIANQHSVKIMQISTSAINTKPDKAVGPEPYQARYVTADLVGEYHQIGAFLNAIDSMDEVISTTDLKMYPDPDNAQNQSVTLMMKVYVE
jgi:Tfp pilus assembly protein PilO